MATVAAINPARPAAKPARSRTYPLREPKTSNNGPSRKTLEPFDPDELRRKLEAYIAEQKLEAEQRRAHVNKKRQQGAYHHVPKVAAADFEKTATPESMGRKDIRRRYIQKLGQAALKHQTKELAAQATTPLIQRKQQAPDQARVQGELSGERNQFQKPCNLDDAMHSDEKTSKKLPPHAVVTDYLDINQNVLSIRPFSTGDLFWEDGLHSNNAIFPSKLQPDPIEIPYASDPQDWAQSDQVSADPHRSMKERVSPFLRRPDSIWTLKSKRDPKHQRLTANVCQVALPVEPKYNKSMFLSLFKRQE